MSLVTFAVRAASGNWKGWTVQLVRTRRNTLRHSFATPLLAAGYDIRTVQQTARAPIAVWLVDQNTANKSSACNLSHMPPLIESVLQHLVHL